MYKDVVIVGLNPALDRTIVFDKFVLGKTNTIKNEVTGPGGKAINVSLSLKNLGVGSLLTGIVAGENGNLIKKALKKKGIETSFVEARGETRTNYKIYNSANKVTTEMNSRGKEISLEDRVRFLKHLSDLMIDCNILVLSGSLPLGFSSNTYCEIIKEAKRRNIQVILDTRGLTLKNSMEGLPYAIKPNLDELEEYAGRKLCLLEDIIIELNSIIKKGVRFALVSLGKEGAVAMNDEIAIYAESFDIIPKSPVGAGDSMVAALVYALLNKLDIRDTVKWMVAFSTVTASLDTGCFCSASEARNALKKIKTKKIFIKDLHSL